MIKNVLNIFLIGFLLSACVSQQPIISNSCDIEVLLDESQIVDFDTCNKHRLIWKKAFEICKGQQ